MVSTGEAHLVGVFIFFITLNTIVVSLRMYVRLWLKKSAFGWDDVFLIITYIGLILFITSAMMAIHYGVIDYRLVPRDVGEAARWTAIMNVVCYVISGTVKLSVALVIYRLLDYRPVLRAIIAADIGLCLAWTLASTLVLSLGCTGTYISPYRFGPAVCHGTFYAQEASYIFFDTFHVVFPISLLWNVQIKNGQKTSVIILFSVGLLSTVAAVLKLVVVIQVFHVPATSRYQDLWQRAVTWAVSEHGLSLFAAAILALRPLCRPITRGWTSLSDTVKSQLYTSTSTTSRRDSWMSRPPTSNTSAAAAAGAGAGPAGGDRHFGLSFPAPTAMSVSTTTIAGAKMPTAARKYSWASVWTAAGSWATSSSGGGSGSGSSGGGGGSKRPSTSTASGNNGTPRAYLARVSETEHRLMPYRSSDPTGGAGNHQWNWTSQWPTEFRAPPLAAAPPSTKVGTPAAAAATATSPFSGNTPGAAGGGSGGNGGAAATTTTFSRATSYDWPPSPRNGEDPASTSAHASNNRATGAFAAQQCGNNNNNNCNNNHLLHLHLHHSSDNGGNNNNNTTTTTTTTTTTASGRATQRNTPDYFTCVVEANERNMTVQEYLRTLGVSSRLTDRESPKSSLEGAAATAQTTQITTAAAAAAAANTNATTTSPPASPGGRNWFEGRRLSHMLL